MREKYVKEHTISIKKFLKIYMGINDSKILDSRISHKDLKYLYPSLKRLPYDYAFSDMKKILSGDIILVVDDFNTYIPYEAPEAQFNVDLIDKYGEYTDNDFRDKHILKKEELEELSTYELSKICRVCKKNNRSRDYRIAYRILKSKKEEKQKTDKHKKRKEII